MILHDGRQILEGVDLLKLPGVNDAHIEITNSGTIFGEVEQAILSCQDRFF